MTTKTTVRIATSVFAAALLSACASHGPQVTAQTEANTYRSHAGRGYTAPGPASDPWGPYVQEASAKYDVPERWIREVMRQESGGKLYGRGGDLITSGAGAMGLMQVMPATYDELRRRYSELGGDPFNPHDNIMAGTAYIREMYDIYGTPGFLAAYNAGPGRMDDYLTRSRTLPDETRRYVANIGPRIANAEPRRPSPGAQYAANGPSLIIPAGNRDDGRYNAPPPAPFVAPVITLTPPAPAPVQLAAARTQGPYIVLRPQPVEVAELPDPAPAPVTVASITPAPFTLTPFTLAPALSAAPPPAPRLAQLPAPPPYVAPPATRDMRTQQAMAAAVLVPVAPPRSGGFGLISAAHAEPIGLHHPGGPAPQGGWGVQVGAFVSENLASSATTSARGNARDVLGAARTSITPVRQPHGVLYRARLLGLSHDAASQACDRLARARTSCMLVSPDAQL